MAVVYCNFIDHKRRMQKIQRTPIKTLRKTFKYFTPMENHSSSAFFVSNFAMQKGNKPICKALIDKLIQTFQNILCRNQPFCHSERSEESRAHTRGCIRDFSLRSTTRHRRYAPLDDKISHVEIDDTVKRSTVDSLGRKNIALFVNESGLYALILLPSADGNSSLCDVCVCIQIGLHLVCKC